jgi:hypothetical protein
MERCAERVRDAFWCEEKRAARDQRFLLGDLEPEVTLEDVEELILRVMNRDELYEE